MLFSFCKTENCNGARRVTQGGKNETKSNVNKNTKTYLLCMEKGVIPVDEKILKK